MDELSQLPSCVLQGHDTVECAYYLSWGEHCGIDFSALRAKRDDMRNSRSRDPLVIKLGDEEFLIQPYGSSSGYPLVLTNPLYSIQCGENNNPSFFVTYSSLGLWQDGLKELHHRFLRWANSMNIKPFREEACSRVDFNFDYYLPDIDFDEDSFVTLLAKDNKHRNHGIAQTFNLGAGGDVSLRVYNKVDEIEEKSQKRWFYDLWGRKDSVWRIEFQVRKALLRRFGIRSYEDLEAQQGDLLRYLVTDHTSLRAPTADSNRSRWPIHPLWLDLRVQIEKLSATGIYRDGIIKEDLNLRELRIAISVYGYLKQLAAIMQLQLACQDITNKHALNHLSTLMDSLHDGLTWESTVRKRADLIRLGAK